MRRTHDWRGWPRAARVLGPALACVAVLALFGGCRSDEATGRGTTGARRAPAAQKQQGTTDRGSRLVNFTAPLGGLTVETPPVQGRQASAPTQP